VGLAEKFSVALDKARADEKTKGLVLDLRFANGLNYAEAVKAADFFVSEERLLLDWGTGNAKSTAKDSPFKLPTMVLVNAQTRGAAEALAAVLREARAALVIGGKTAGEANLFREFTLDGQRVCIASGKVKLAGGDEMPAGGLAPDIEVSVGLDEEKAFLADPFKAGANRTPESAATSGAATNAPRRRINEAELVRLQKEGRSPDDENGGTNATPARAETARPIVRDPALARALDLLKGLAIVKPGK
jgi:C-terminal processing protease CtpA/Prc